MNMDELFIEATPGTPEVKFSPIENVFYMSGRSIPEDGDEFFSPILRYLKDFKKTLSETSFGRELLFEFKLVYYNTVSMRYLNFVMKCLEDISENTKVKVNWYYDRDDEVMEELGKYMIEIHSVDINMIEVEPPPKKGKKP